MKRKLLTKVLVVIMLSYQIISSVVSIPVASASENNANALRVSLEIPEEAVLGMLTKLKVHLKEQTQTDGASKPENWDYNVGIQLVLPDGLEMAGSQKIYAPTSTGVTADGKQIVYWRDFKDMSPGEEYEFEVNLKVMEYYRQQPTVALDFGAVLSNISVNVYSSNDSRKVREPSDSAPTDTKTIPAPKVTPFLLEYLDVAKEVKGAGTTFNAGSGAGSEWGAFAYQLKLTNNSLYPTVFTSLISNLDTDLDAVGFRIKRGTAAEQAVTGASSPVKQTVGAVSGNDSVRAITWTGLTLATKEEVLLSIDAAFFNKAISDGLINTGNVLEHGHAEHNTLSYTASVNRGVLGNYSASKSNLPFEKTEYARDIAIYKSANKQFVGYGSEVEYTLRIKTNEYYDIDNVIVKDEIGDGQTFNETTGISLVGSPALGTLPSSFGTVTDSAYKIAHGKTEVVWNLGHLPKNQIVTIKYKTTIDETWAHDHDQGSIYAGDQLHNTATVTGLSSWGGARAPEPVSDWDSENVEIITPQIKEKIVEVNGNSVGVDPKEEQLTVGDTVTFEVYYNNGRDLANDSVDIGVNAKQHHVVIFNYLPLGTQLLDSQGVPAVGDLADDEAAQSDLTAYNFIVNGGTTITPKYDKTDNLLIWDFGSTDINANSGASSMVAPVRIKALALNNSSVQKTKGDKNLVALSFANSDAIVNSKRDEVKITYVEPDIGLTRKINTTTVYPGNGSIIVNGNQTVTVTLYLKNSGATPAYNVNFIDDLPLELSSPVWVSGPTFSYNSGTRKLTFSEIPTIDKKDDENDTSVLVYTAVVNDSIGALKDIEQKSSWNYNSYPSSGRNYPVFEDHHITIKTKPAVITKTVFDAANGVVNDVRVGDWIIYKIEAKVPVGEKTFNAFITDKLPTNQTLVAVYKGTVSPVNELAVTTDYTLTNSDIKILAGPNLPADPAATYTFYVKTKVNKIATGLSESTQDTKARIDWKDVLGAGTDRFAESSNVHVTVSKPNLKATIDPLVADMTYEGVQTITFKVKNEGLNAAYDFVPTIKIPAGFKIDPDLATQTPDISSNGFVDLDTDYLITYPKQSVLAPGASVTFVFDLILKKVKDSGSGHAVTGSSGFYYPSNQAYLDDPGSDSVSDVKYAESTDTSHITVPSVTLTNTISANSNNNNSSKIRPGDTIDYKLTVTVPKGTIANNLRVEDTLPFLANFDILPYDMDGLDLDGFDETSQIGTKFLFTYGGNHNVDATGATVVKVITLHLRAKNNSTGAGAFAANPAPITTSAVAKWSASSVTNAATNSINVVQPALTIAAPPLNSTDSKFTDSKPSIHIIYNIANSSVTDDVYKTLVEVPIPAGLKATNISPAGTFAAGKVTWNVFTVNGDETKELSFDATIDPTYPQLGASTNGYSLVAKIKQFESTPASGNQLSRIYVGGTATHTLSIGNATLSASVTNNSNVFPGNNVRPGDEVTYKLTIDVPSKSTAYKTILKNTGLIEQEIVSVKNGSIEYPYSNILGGYVIDAVYGSAAAPLELTVVTRVNTNSDYAESVHKTSFKPIVEYQTSEEGSTPVAITTTQMEQNVIEPSLLLQISADKHDIAAHNEFVTYTVTVNNANGAGSSIAYGSHINISIPDAVKLKDVGDAAIGDSVTRNDIDGTIQWTIGAIPVGGHVVLQFTADAKLTTTVTTAIYGKAKLTPYYSLPNEQGKIYDTLQAVTSGGFVTGTHDLDTTTTKSITAGMQAEFLHTLTNNGGGQDTFIITLANAIHPTDLYADGVLIANGSLVNSVWTWSNIRTGFGSEGVVTIPLNSGAHTLLKLKVSVPETTIRDNDAFGRTTVLKAKSQAYSENAPTAQDILKITGTPLDGWVGGQSLYNLNGASSGVTWIKPVYGHNDSFDLQAVSSVNIKAVKAYYTVNSVTYSVYLGNTNSSNYLTIGQKQWSGVSRLPFTVSEGLNGVNFVGYDQPMNTSNSLELEADDASNSNPGINNWFNIRESLTIQGTISKYPSSPTIKIENAKVVLFDVFNNKVVGEPAYTDSNGFYSFPNVNVSEYELRVSKDEPTNPYTQSTVRFYALPPDNVSSSIVIVDATLSQSQYHIVIKANPSTILGDGTSFTTLTAVVSNDAGETLPGVPVVFTTIKGRFGQFDPNHHFQPSTNDLAGRTVVTDIDGKATILLQSEVISGTASVRFPVGVDVNDPNHGGGLYANGSIVMTFDPGAIVGVVTETVKNVDGIAVSKKVKGAIVTVSKKDNNGVIIFSAEMTTGEDGAYKIAIPIGNTDYDVVITKPMLVGGHIEMISFPQVATAGPINAGAYAEFPADKTGSGLLTTKSITGEEILLPSVLAAKIHGFLIDSVGHATAIMINSNGTFNQPNLAPGTYRFAITYENGGNDLIIGSKLPTIIIGDASNPLNDGEMNIALGLIDPYGTVTDAGNGQPLSGAHVTLYFADTPRNVTAGRTPNTPVSTLPIIPGFLPFLNANPEQTTGNDGQYAWMVFDLTDYYVITTKPGYQSDRSPTLSVDGAIVMYNPKLTRNPSPAVVLPENAEAPIVQTQADLAVQLLSDSAAYPEEGIVTFTINYLNKADITVKGATVTAQIPQYTDISDAAGGVVSGSTITWTLGDLAARATGTIIYKVKVKANSLPQAEVKVTNEAVIASTEALVNPEDDKSPISILLFTSRFGDQGHERYIKGYPDGNFKPNRAITRAEIAAIFSRIMDLQSTVTGEQFYNDISRTFWAKEYIETATRVGLFTGYADGGFKPDAPITRAELSTVIFRYLKLTDRAPIKLDFTDIETHWAKNAIEEIFRYHIITGYPDKTFRPGADMIRTEAVTMINRLLNRGPLYGAEVSFPDVNATHWAFGQVEESAITHEYKRYENGSEQLTKYIPEPLW